MGNERDVGILDDIMLKGYVRDMAILDDVSSGYKRGTESATHDGTHGIPLSESGYSIWREREESGLL